MAMDKQARLINEHLEKIDQRLEKIETALGTGEISLEATAEVGDIDIPQLVEIEEKLDALIAVTAANKEKLDALIALLTPPASAEEAKAPAKPAKGIGENKS